MIRLIRPTASAVLISPANGNQSERLIVSKPDQRRSLKFVFGGSARLTLLIGLAALPLAAQTSGSISGTVLDPSGAAITGANVSLVEMASGHQSAGKTNSTGHYEFSALPQGRYTLRIVAPGFRSFQQINAQLVAHQALHIDAKLLVGSTNSTVQVSAMDTPYTALENSAGTRTRTPLIDVPQSVEVLNSKLIRDQDRRTLADALVNVSGVVPLKPEEILFTQLLVRGFPAEIYTDGLSMFGNTTGSNDPTSLVGAERIEVVKGPNSTMYGGGLGSPLGGLVNVVSVRPEPRFLGYVGFRGGNFGTVDPYGDINVPLNSRIAARLTGEYQRNTSWVDVVSGDRWSFQPAMSFQLGPKTNLFVQGRFNHRDQLEYSGVPAVQAMSGQIDRNAFVGAPVGQPHTRLDSRMATAELNHDFNDNVRWNISARYYFSQANEHGSFVLPSFAPPDPATPTVYPILTLDMSNNPVREGTFDTNLSASLHGLGGWHGLLAGVSYDHTNFYSEMGFSGIPVGEQDLAHPTYNLLFGPATPASLFQTDRYQTTAVYGQDQATYGRFSLTGSVRYTKLDFREREQATDKTYNHASGRIGGTFRVANGVALYVAYATAFRGAFGLVVQQAPKPETSQNVEGGVKLALDKAHLAGTVAIFNQTRNNVATADPTNFLYSIQTGQQRSRGAEADLTWEPIRAFSLLANYAYTQATVTQDNSIPVGDFLQRVPRNSGRVAGRYRIQNGVVKGLSFGAGVTAFTKREITLPNTVAVPGYAAVDAQASYDFGRYTLQGSATNLTARKTFDPYQYFGFPVVMPNQPISGFATLKIRFGKD
jgi:iron complex outermembrane receptor protein